MDREAEFEEIKKIVFGIKHYDVDGFILELKKWVEDLAFFYNEIVKDGENPSSVSYRLSKSNKPEVGEMAFIKLRRGYPKELYNSHWCYILRDTGNSFIVIPSTSVKKDSSHCDERFEMDIEIDDFINDCVTRLQITQIRCVDYARVSTSGKNHYKVLTNKDDIIKQINKVLFSDCYVTI